MIKWWKSINITSHGMLMCFITIITSNIRFRLDSQTNTLLHSLIMRDRICGLQKMHQSHLLPLEMELLVDDCDLSSR